MRARDNPYRVQRVHALAFRLTATNWRRLWERFQDLDRRGCVVGPHGSGKTTFLQALAALLTKRGLAVRWRTVRADDDLGRDEPAIWCRGLGGSDVLVLDGADLLSRPQWRRLKHESRRASGLIVSSHGRPLLSLLYRCQTTPALLEELMRELHPANGCGQPAPDELFARHGGDLREALRELYDFHAQIRGASGCVIHEPSRPSGRPAARVGEV